LLVTRDIADLLDGMRPGAGFPEVGADLIVGRFLAGWLLTVSRKSAPDVDLERLEGLDDVWVLCFRTPPPGWRVLGRFLEKDVFVGLRAYDRHTLGARASYSARANDVIEDWKRVFGAMEPLRAGDLDSYLSGVYRDADQADDD